MDKENILNKIKKIIRVDSESKKITITNIYSENELNFTYNDYINDIDSIKQKIIDYLKEKHTHKNIFILLYFEKNNIDISYYILVDELFRGIFNNEPTWNLFVSDRININTALVNMDFFIHISCDPCLIMLPNIQLFDEYYRTPLMSDIIDIYTGIIMIVNGSENKIVITKNSEDEINKIKNDHLQIADFNIKNNYPDLIIANNIVDTIRENISGISVSFFVGHHNLENNCIEFCVLNDEDSIYENDLLSLCTDDKKHLDIVVCETGAHKIKDQDINSILKNRELAVTPFFQSIRNNDNAITNITFIKIDILKSFIIFAVKVRNHLFRHNIIHMTTKSNQTTKQIDALTGSINSLLNKI